MRQFFTAAVVSVVAAGALSLSPARASAQTYSLTTAGVLTTLTATGSFAADGFADGDPYVFTDTFSGGCNVGAFGQSSLVYGCGRNTITARIDGHTFTHTFGPPDQPFPLQYAAMGISVVTNPAPTVYDMGANITEYTAPLGGGDFWQLVMIDNTTTPIFASLDPAQTVVHNIDPATEGFYQFGLVIRDADGSLLAAGQLNYTGGPPRTVVLNGGIPEPAAWVLMLVGVGAVGALARRRSATSAAFRATR